MELLESQTPAKPAAASEAEERYRAAQARLRAAQQEKMEATDEFLAARAALRDGLDTKRPAPAREYGLADRSAAWAGA